MVAKRASAAARTEPSKAPAKRSTTALEAIVGNEASPLALDRLIHERARLAIVSALAVHEMLTFNELKALLETSDGNLSVHARKLEDAKYVRCSKVYDGRTPRTEYRLSPTGRQALERYLAHMESLIRRVGERS